MGSAKSIEELRQALDAVFGNETVPGLGPYDASDMLDDALDELERLRKAARDVLIDNGQDALEDPCGHQERLPYCRIHIHALDSLSLALKGSP